MSDIDDIVNEFTFPTSPQDPEQAPEIDVEEESAPVESVNPTYLSSDLDELENDLDDAALIGKTQASINSFEGLKSRYKNTITKIRAELEQLQSAQREQESKTSNYGELDAKARAYDDLLTKFSQLESDNERLKRDNEEASYYRKRYDLENDPQTKREFVAPMQDLKRRTIDILINTGNDDSVWDDLVSADSEYKINHLIESAGISGLNAQSVKQYLSQYRTLNAELKKSSSPEYIDAAIEASRGKRQRITDDMAKESFTSIKEQFSKHVRELQHSQVNREHNFFVHDKVVEAAERSYNALRPAIAPEFHTPQTHNALSQLTLMANAYPFQKKLVDHLITERTALLEELNSIKAGPTLKKTSQATPKPKPIDAQNDTIDDITQDFYRALSS